MAETAAAEEVICGDRYGFDASGTGQKGPILGFWRFFCVSVLTGGDWPALVGMEVDRSKFDSEIVAQLTQCQMAIRCYVQSLMPGDRSAPDVAQQANAKIWEKRSEFELGTNFKAWAFAIARYEVLNYRKQQLRDSRMHFSSELETQLSEDMEVREDSLEMRQEALSKCLEMLDERQRELLMHRYASTATLGEVASQTNRSVGSLKVTLHRLRSKLLSCINRRMAGGEA